MRYVDRKSVIAPKSLSDATGAGNTELAKAKQHYAKPDASAYEFKAYKGDDVVAALRDLFKKKCAYCESNFEAVSTMDIEHYRPKGGVKDDNTHSGYWWLAASWDNLLASCIDCNRERYQHLATKDMTQRDLDAVKRILSGKKDAFPIAGKRARKESDDHAAEDPLLIDPTRRDPGQHLSWEELLDDERGTEALSIVTAKRNAGVSDPYGDESIAIYGLNRRGLVEERTLLLRALKTQAARIESWVMLAAIADAAMLPSMLVNIEKDFTDFRSHASDERKYSRCAKAYIDQASATIVARLKELKGRLWSSNTTQGETTS